MPSANCELRPAQSIVLAEGAGEVSAGAAGLRDGNGQLADGSARLAAGASGVAPGALLPWMLAFGAITLAAISAWFVHRVRFSRRAGVVTATMLNATVPALTVQQGGGANTTFFVRGVGNFTNNGYSDPAIAFNLDGIYLGRPTSTTGTFFEMNP